MPYFHYAFLEAPLLITLLIGFVFQVFTKSTNSTSHSEKVIAAQIKIIGAVKLLLLIATATCYFLETQTSAAIKLFFLIDLLLVPVAIELTEIRFNPNVINFSDNVLVPHEVILLLCSIEFLLVPLVIEVTEVITKTDSDNEMREGPEQADDHF
ncbi:hypothetical protein CAEBREN_25938 [Caenorhabditis brenneri]|uniref:Uncharacterized protein n=1 Tax=Caenorhabditis brenneri TaxID=135651 RepID=G0M9W1_CAEBE|nr:hypothetical protein CAEBREN_25938 [Caenorhabditis brenneri]